MSLVVVTSELGLCLRRCISILSMSDKPGCSHIKDCDKTGLGLLHSSTLQTINSSCLAFNKIVTNSWT